MKPSPSLILVDHQRFLLNTPRRTDAFKQFASSPSVSMGSLSAPSQSFSADNRSSSTLTTLVTVRNGSPRGKEREFCEMQSLLAPLKQKCTRALPSQVAPQQRGVRRPIASGRRTIPKRYRQAAAFPLTVVTRRRPPLDCMEMCDCHSPNGNVKFSTIG